MLTPKALVTTTTLLQLAGIVQILLTLLSLLIPKILNWRAELVQVRPLIKQMFWTYAGYILMINLCFGLLSFSAANDLVNGSKLALCINGFITIYWISRVLIQFFYFDRTSFPTGNWYKLGEALLVLLFVFLSSVYSYAFYVNYIHS